MYCLYVCTVLFQSTLKSSFPGKTFDYTSSCQHTELNTNVDRSISVQQPTISINLSRGAYHNLNHTTVLHSTQQTTRAIGHSPTLQSARETREEARDETDNGREGASRFDPQSPTQSI